MFAGTILGSGIKKQEEENILFSPIMQEIHETENTAVGKAETEKEIKADIPVTENSFGMPLKEDTVLLVTVKRTADWIWEEYDDEGHILRYLEPRYGHGKNIEYEYDTEGNIILETCYGLGEEETDPEINYWIEYSYGKDAAGEGIQTKWEYYADGSLHSKTVYDCEGERLQDITYMKDGKLGMIYEYDPSKRQQWLTEYDEEGNVEWQYRTDYDDQGNEILNVEYDAEGNISPVRGCACDPEEYIPYWRYENSYDEAGNLIRQIVYDINDTQTGYREYAYDEDGNIIINAEYDGENEIVYYCEYTYDEKGNLVSSFSSDESGTYEAEYAYEYDMYGHCVKKTGGLSTVWERKYDADNRLIKYTDGDGDRYYYKYTPIGALDEDYPFDKIKVR